MKLSVTVCLCTFRRASVVDTLHSLAAQQLPPDVVLDVVVVDSDSAQSAADRVAQAAARLPLAIRYLPAGRPGIAAARNAAVRHAGGEWLAFLDDDEVAAPDWIARLVAQARASAAGVVFGAVHTVYPPGCPDWIRRADLFGKSLPPSGTPVDCGPTCNALVARELLARESEVFNAAYGHTGGEDTELFHRLARRGVRMVTCREAVVRETVETRRLNRDYLLAKAERVGETYFRIFVAGARPARRLAVLARAALQWLGGLVIATVLRPFGLGRSMVFRIKAAANLGKLRAALGRPAIELYKV
ncbi:MAG: glycosyltransferase [Rhodocyclaceae bacterium]|nr:glycosyltransferase [Rhodocyclaceae bacterium]